MSTRSPVSQKVARPTNRSRHCSRPFARPVAQFALTTALRRAIRGFYECYRKEKWELCYNRIDPRLLAGSKVDFNCYRDSLVAFKQRYGDVIIRMIDVGETHKSKRDRRPFAYASIIWQDRHAEFHVFRERWIFHDARWYTRVVGLITHQEQASL